MSGSQYEYKYIPATMCYNAEHETNFAEVDMETMKSMVRASNPSEVHSVARGWADVHDRLVGGSAANDSGGGGGILKVFNTAVEEVLKDWEGQAAEAFATEARKIAKKISDGAQYARYTSLAMGNAASALEQIKPEVESMEAPGTASRAWDYATDWDRDDSGLRRDLGSPDVTTQQALDNNRDDLSKGKEAQLEMAVKMEQLGAAYASQYRAMGTWEKRPRPIDSSEDYPGEPGGAAPVPAVVPIGSSGPKPTGGGSINPASRGVGHASSGGVAAPRPNGISGGVGAATGDGALKAGAHIGTGLNGVSVGARGPGLGGSGNGLGGDVGESAGGPGAASGFVGVPGTPGAIGGATGRGGTGVRGGRPGTPGMGGSATGSGAGGAKGATRGGGALARQRGGVVGAAKGTAAAGSQGGSGLHRSRGGTQAGRPGGNRGAGVAGAPGVRGANADSERERGAQRPDYLVEDEETWTPQRDVAPRVIE